MIGNQLREKDIHIVRWYQTCKKLPGRNKLSRESEVRSSFGQASLALWIRRDLYLNENALTNTYGWFMKRVIMIYGHGHLKGKYYLPSRVNTLVSGLCEEAFTLSIWYTVPRVVSFLIATAVQSGMLRVDKGHPHVALPAILAIVFGEVLRKSARKLFVKDRYWQLPSKYIGRNSSPMSHMSVLMLNELQWKQRKKNQMKKGNTKGMLRPF